MKELLAELGLKLPDLFAGFCGGVVNAFVFRKANAWDVIGSVVVGMLTANYLSSPAAQIIGTSGPPTAFIVGLCGMAICQGLFTAARKWRPALPNGGGDGRSS